MTDHLITFRVSDEVQQELEAIAAQFGYASIDAFVEAMQPEIVESFREMLRMIDCGIKNLRIRRMYSICLRGKHVKSIAQG